MYCGSSLHKKTKMKTYIQLFVLLSMILVSQVSTAQVNMKAFKEKDFSEIESMLLSDVSLKIGSKKKIKGANQAISVIRRTLDEFEPIKMEMKHKGSSSMKEDNYMIARLINAQNQTLRVFVHLENTASGKKICDIKIRKS